MKSGSMTLYFNSEYGFIFAPETTIKGSIIHATMNPVMTEKADITSEKLGEEIWESLKRSRDAKPVDRSEIKNFKFWQVSGIKGFSSFSKNFKCIDITEEEDKLCLSRLIRDKDGGYSYPDKASVVRLQTMVTKEELGKCVFKLFATDEDRANNDNTSFISVNEKKVSYVIPSDDFLDIGDGHTDAYRIFEYEEAPSSYIAFLIDNGYLTQDRGGIERRWEKMYGELLEFNFQESNINNLKYVVSAKTKKAVIRSNFYMDGDNLLEVSMFMDTSKLTKKQQQCISTEFDKVLGSIEIS